MGGVPRDSPSALAVTAVPGGARERFRLPTARSMRRYRAALRLLGPAFVASVAYVDPGNFATNFAGGAEHGYELVWVIVMANLMAILVQYLTSKARPGHRPQPARTVPGPVRPARERDAWLQAEIVAMATDLAEFVGAAVGHQPGLRRPAAAGRADHRRRRIRHPGAWSSGATAVSSWRSSRCSHWSAPASCTCSSPPATSTTASSPPAWCPACGAGTLGLAVGDHRRDRHAARGLPALGPAEQPGARGRPQQRRTLLTYNKWDCIIGLGLAGLVNLAMLCIAAALFHKPGPDRHQRPRAVHAHLTTLVGGGAALAFGVALMASGLSSSSVGTYAGQVVMAGFMNWRIPLLARRASDDAAFADHPRPGRQHQPGAGLLPDRLVLRHSLRPDPAAARHPRPRQS